MRPDESDEKGKAHRAEAGAERAAGPDGEPGAGAPAESGPAPDTAESGPVPDAAEPGPAPEPDPADMARRLAEAEEKARENWDRFLRARADLENYRKRVDRDLAAMVRRGKRDLLTRLLDVADALERAAAWEASQKDAGGRDAQGGDGGDDAAREGFALIHRQLLKVLSDEGVEPIESVGRPFDPAVHEAVAVETREDVKAETVVEELQKGYTYEGEVLRCARVRVARPT
ncbi:MAG TPA: nucleotide exchange factor GrpE [Clostridiales bacterium]|nr:nucleotide exchange factor GrpE [Clostridiales bacterium]